MLTPDLNLLRRQIGLAEGEDFRWVHEIKFYHNSYGTFGLRLGGNNSTYAVSTKFLRSLTHLSRLDRKIDQRKHP
jgi:hypothetical protein